jgi:hypothetical protein
MEVHKKEGKIYIDETKVVTNTFLKIRKITHFIKCTGKLFTAIKQHKQRWFDKYYY